MYGHGHDDAQQYTLDVPDVPVLVHHLIKLHFLHLHKCLPCQPFACNES